MRSLTSFRFTAVIAFAVLDASTCYAQTAKKGGEPIIDMHLHALHADDLGPPPQFISAPNPLWPTRDPKTPGGEYGATFTKTPPCASPLRSPTTS
jgi:uncharacterized protein